MVDDSGQAGAIEITPEMVAQATVVLVESGLIPLGRSVVSVQELAKDCLQAALCLSRSDGGTKAAPRKFQGNVASWI